MSDNKEDSLRKKAKSSLDSKGWEALLEGVPRVDENESHDETAEETVKKVIDGPSSPRKNIFKVKDESGGVSEHVTSKEAEKSIDSSHETPHPSSELVSEKPAAQSDSKELTEPDLMASSESKQGDQKTSVQPSRGEEPPALSEILPSQVSEQTEAKGIFGRLWIWLQAQPLFQRLHHYYRGLNPRDQRILQVGFYVLSALMVYTLILSPLSEKNAIFNRQIEKKTEDLAEINRLSYSVIQSRGGMDRIKKVIDQRGVGFSIFAYLEQLATKAEMKDKIIYIKPQRQTNVGSFKESLAEIKLDNINLEELTRFLYEIETSEDLLYIKNVKIKTRSSRKDQEGLEVILSVGTLIKGG